MKMTIQKIVWLCFLAGLLVPFQEIHADECEDASQEAAAINRSANEALEAKDYENAAALYEQAAEEFEKVSGMKGCRCPVTVRAARAMVVSCRDWAAKCNNRTQNAQQEPEAAEQASEAAEQASEDFEEEE